MHIAPYQAGLIDPPPPRRPRKLLAHRAEIRRLTQRTRERGYTLVPLRVYFRDGKAKLTLGVCKGQSAVRQAGRDQAPGRGARPGAFAAER